LCHSHNRDERQSRSPAGTSVFRVGAQLDDHILVGRWGLNIVSGYSSKEMAGFGFRQPSADVDSIVKKTG
jgi:hypothetical protein